MALFKQPWFVILLFLASLYTYQYASTPGNLQLRGPVAMAATNAPGKAPMAPAAKPVAAAFTKKISMRGLTDLELKIVDFQKVDIRVGDEGQALELQISGEGIPPKGEGHFFKDWLALEIKNKTLLIASPQREKSELKWPSREELLNVVKGETNKGGLILSLTVPKTVRLENVNLNLLSSDLELQGLSAESLQVKAVSGELSIIGGQYQRVDVKSVSGLLQTKTQVVDEIRVKSISGDMELDWSQQVLPPSHQISTVSGSVKAIVQDRSALNVKFSSTSGDLTRRAGVVDESGAPIKVSTVSGNMLIETL